MRRAIQDGFLRPTGRLNRLGYFVVSFPGLPAVRQKKRYASRPEAPSGNGRFALEQRRVHAGVVEDVLLRDAGVFAEIRRGNAG